MASTGRKKIVFCVTVVFIDKLHRTRQIWQVENEQYLPRDDHVTQRQREAGPTYPKCMFTQLLSSLFSWKRRQNNQYITTVVTQQEICWKTMVVNLATEN